MLGWFIFLKVCICYSKVPLNLAILIKATFHILTKSNIVCEKPAYFKGTSSCFIGSNIEYTDSLVSDILWTFVYAKENDSVTIGIRVMFAIRTTPQHRHL